MSEYLDSEIADLQGLKERGISEIAAAILVLASRVRQSSIALNEDEWKDAIECGVERGVRFGLHGAEADQDASLKQSLDWISDAIENHD